MTSIKKENPQIELSKEWLSRALLNLMKKKNYKQISVTELADCAGLSRQTFYRHFSSIEDVLDHTLKKISDLYVSFVLYEPRVDLQSSTYRLFYFWRENQNFLKILKNNNLFYIILEDYFPAVRNKISEELKEEIYPTNTENLENFEYITAFYEGGLWNLLIKWLEDGAKLSPGEMLKIAERYMK